MQPGAGWRLPLMLPWVASPAPRRPTAKRPSVPPAKRFFPMRQLCGKVQCADASDLRRPDGLAGTDCGARAPPPGRSQFVTFQPLKPYEVICCHIGGGHSCGRRRNGYIFEPAGGARAFGASDTFNTCPNAGRTSIAPKQEQPPRVSSHAAAPPAAATPASANKRRPTTPPML